MSRPSHRCQYAESITVVNSIWSRRLILLLWCDILITSLLWIWYINESTMHIKRYRIITIFLPKSSLFQLLLQLMLHLHVHSRHLADLLQLLGCVITASSTASPFISVRMWRVIACPPWHPDNLFPELVICHLWLLLLDPPLGLIWTVMLVWRKGNINRTVSVL